MGRKLQRGGFSSFTIFENSLYESNSDRIHLTKKIIVKTLELGDDFKFMWIFKTLLQW